jgi:hypothetical protein
MSRAPTPEGVPTPSNRSAGVTMSSHMRVIRERIERDEYEIDPERVAAAILARLTSPKANGGACEADSPGRRNQDQC